MQDWAIWSIIFVAVNVVLAVSVTIHAVLRKRDSRSVIGWVGLAWLAPILGAVSYAVFGINRIYRKASSLNLGELPEIAALPSLTQDDEIQVQEFRRQHPQLIGLVNAGRTLSGLAITPGNAVDVLVDGDQCYPAMIEAIDGAQHSISLLSYIFDSDAAGDQFLDALVRANRRNVNVRVLIDAVGARYSKPSMVTRLEQSGIPIAKFLPTRIPRLPRYTNLRNHRKIMVVDGHVGFTGGTNIRAGHWLELDPTHPVQCLHFRLTGPVVVQLQRVFAIDWAFTTGEHLSGEIWFPRLRRAGDVWARGIEHGPDENFEKLTDLIAAALSIARNQVRIVTPYFLPQSSLIQALNVTAMRGVNVEIYIPSRNNIPLVQWASTAQLWQNLDKGCRVFSTAEPFDHTKVMIVDNIWSLIGSTNWDPRSLRLNFEFNVECYSRKLATALNAVIDRKAFTAREVTMQAINGRNMPTQLRDGLARLLSPYL